MQALQVSRRIQTRYLPTGALVVYDMRNPQSPCGIMCVVCVCCTHSLKRRCEDMCEQGRAGDTEDRRRIFLDRIWKNSVLVLLSREKQTFPVSYGTAVYVCDCKRWLGDPPGRAVGYSSWVEDLTQFSSSLVQAWVSPACSFVFVFCFCLISVYFLTHTSC